MAPYTSKSEVERTVSVSASVLYGEDIAYVAVSRGVGICNAHECEADDVILLE
jgi:hypothetical protein